MNYKNTTIAPMLMQRSDNLLIHPMSGPRLLDGEDAAAKAAAEAKAKADADAAAKAASDAAAKEVADKAAADAAKAAADKELADKLKGLSDSEAKLLKENMAAKAKIKETADALAAAQAALAAFQGLDPTKAAELKAALEKSETEAKKAQEDALKKAGDWEALKTMMATENKKVVDDVTSKLTQTQGALDQATKTIEELTVGSSFSQSDFITKSTVLTPQIARQVYGSHFDVVNGKVVGFNKPRGETGRAPLVDGFGNNVPFEQAIKTIVEGSTDKDSILRSNLRPGAGTNTTNVRGQGGADTVVTDPARGINRIKDALSKGALAKKEK